jgi:hypothetical protein
MAPLLVSPPAASAPSHHRAASLGAAEHGPSTTPGTPPHGAATPTSCLVTNCCDNKDPSTVSASCPGVELRPLEGEALGCEVLGLDLMAHPITPPLVAALRQALLRHQVRASKSPGGNGGWYAGGAQA